MKAQNALDEDWDYLIVLDACRYDAFLDCYEEYLDGRVEKRRSPGSSTPEWATKTFTGDHDIAYFSSNPFINSLGLPLSEIRWGASCDYEWSASDHIAEVIDLWQSAWDDDLGTVPPGNVNEAVRSRPETIEAHPRTIIHYMQPHAPYLRRGRGRKTRRIRQGIRDQSNGGGDDSWRSVRDALRSRVERALGRSSFAMQLGMWIELDLDSLLAVGTDGSRATLWRYYEENLRIVLESVVDLLADLDGRVVVTADHGEAFGEDGIWEHHVETPIPALVEVPWLEIE